jgi:predicted DNA-binding protein with PD1-like motif
MKFKKIENGYVVRLERGEKVVAMLADFCAQQNIQSGFFHAIGAVNNAEIGYYSLSARNIFLKRFLKIAKSRA